MGNTCNTFQHETPSHWHRLEVKVCVSKNLNILMVVCGSNLPTGPEVGGLLMDDESPKYIIVMLRHAGDVSTC